MSTLARLFATAQHLRAGVVALSLGLGCALAGAAPPEPAAIEVVTQAQFRVGNVAGIPDMTGQATTPLPDHWRATHPRFSGSVWYRAGFATPSSAGRGDGPALYIERACGNVEVHLNGWRIFGNGRSVEPVSRNCAYPHLVDLPPSVLLRDATNVLDLRVQGHALQRVAAVQRAGGLSVLKIGPQTLLAVEHDQQLFWRVTVVQIAAGVLAVLGCVLLLLGWPARRGGHAWVLGALQLGWALLSLRLWLRDIPLDPAVVEFIATAGLAPLAALAVVFLLRHAHWTFGPLNVALLMQCLLVPMSMLLAGPNRLHLMSTAWAFVLGSQVLAAMGLSLALTWPKRRVDFWVMAPLFALTAAVLLLELALQLRLLGMPAVDFTQLGLSAVLLVLGVRVLVRYARDSAGSVSRKARQAELAAKKNLEAQLHLLTAEHDRTLAELAALRVEALAAPPRKRPAPAPPAVANEAERSLAHMAELHVEQATAQERKRIAADLHDDLGAKLLTIVHTSESDKISALAREALEEMRLSVRGLSGKPMRLADALADWRAETVARLSQANIEIDWRGPAEETDERLAARSFVQTTRILREAISNVIKHSGASQCKVRCGIRDREFGLVVQDNGNGISVDLDGKLDRGHGMASMKNRAKQMQGQCLVESGPGYGTVIRLTLPL
jgi:two-component system, NarL family, sensor histidine kinase UhpB